MLDIRLPQMQVGPNVVRRRAGKDAAEDALENLVTEEVRQGARDCLERECHDYFRSVDKVMNHIVSH